MAKILWLVKLRGEPIGRHWASITQSEFDILESLKGQGYDPEITVELASAESVEQL